MLKKSILGSVLAVSVFTVGVFATVGTIQAATDSDINYDKLRANYVQMMVNDPNIIKKQPSLQELANSITDNAKKLWQTMNKDDVVRDFLWTGPQNDYKTREDLAVQYDARNLRTMAKAYNLPGELYHNKQLEKDIVNALDWLITKHYNPNVPETGDWYPWEIGGPSAINEVIILMYNSIPKDKIHRYMEYERNFLPDPHKLGQAKGGKELLESRGVTQTSTGGNRAMQSVAVIARGIVDQNKEDITLALDAMFSTFAINDTPGADGFHSDGGFFNHYDIPYNIIYGREGMQEAGKMLKIMGDSPLIKDNEEIALLSDKLERAFMPFYYKGVGYASNAGRVAATENIHDAMVETLAMMTYFLPFLDTYEQARLKSYIKREALADPSNHPLESIEDISAYGAIYDILNDNAVKPLAYKDETFIIPSEDALISRTSNYAFVLAMHSSRVGSYECMNGDNLRGWYTTDGMTYVYDDDSNKYDIQFFRAVDAYNMSGTTEDSRKMEPCSGQRTENMDKLGKPGRVQDMDWVGGATNGFEAIAGMDYYNWDESLTAKKSWFVFNNKIVALGADIKSKNKGLHTVLENQILSSSNKDNIYINGALQDSRFNYDTNISNIFIDGSKTRGSSVGYALLTPMNGHLSRARVIRDPAETDGRATAERRNPRINQMFYATIDNDKVNNYAYVIIPKATLSSVQEPQHVNILQNNAKAQAVEYDNFVGANFFTPTELQSNITNSKIKSNNQVSILIERTAENEYTVSVSDPTWQQKSITIDFGKTVQLIKNSADNRASTDNTQILVDTDSYKGQTVKFSIKTE